MCRCMASEIDFRLHNAAWSGGHLLLADPEDVGRVRRKLLSASVASKTLQCPASMAAARLLPRVSDPFSDGEIGTAMHAVFEELYTLPATARTPEAVDLILAAKANEEWAVDKLEKQSKDVLSANADAKGRWLEVVGALAHGIFALEDPQQVIVVANELNIIIDIDGIPTTCYVDRLDWMPLPDGTTGAITTDDLAVLSDQARLDRIALIRLGKDAEWRERKRADARHRFLLKLHHLVRSTPTGSGKLIVRDYKKGLEISTPIATPSGWTTVGELAVGDQVFAPSGRVTSITSVTDVAVREGYRLTFSDGSQVVSDHIHDWVVRVPTDFGTKSRTLQLDARSLHSLFTNMVNAGRTLSITIDNTAPLAIDNADVDVDPYVLGAWLGDGKSTGTPIFTSESDVDEMLTILQNRWQGDVAVKRYQNVASPEIHLRARSGHCSRGHDVAILTTGRRTCLSDRTPRKLKRGGCRTCVAELSLARHYARAPERPEITNLTLGRRLRTIGVLGNKHVPVAYLRGSVEQRIDLVRGLMDTDGSWNPRRRRAVFVNTNPDLIRGLVWLLRSMGITVQTLTVPAREGAKEHYRVEFTPTGFNPFLLSRKANAAAPHVLPGDAHLKSGGPVKSRRVTLVNIEPIEQIESKCLSVDAPEQMFLCGEALIPTHNSNDPKKLKTPSPQYGDDYGDQQRLYVAAIETAFGVRPAEATLLFPALGKPRKIDVSARAVSTMLVGYRNAWKLMNDSADRQKFETRPSGLCPWCSLANSCPVAKIGVSSARDPLVREEKIGKQLAAAARQPSAVQLGIPTLRPGADLQEALSTLAPGVQVPRQPEPQDPTAAAAAALVILPVGDDLFPVTIDAVSTDTPPIIPDGLPGAVEALQQAGVDPHQQVDVEPRMWSEEHAPPIDGGMTEGTDPMHTNTTPRAESASYEETTNGALNLNSYAAMAVSGLVSQAFEHLTSQNQQVSTKSLSHFSNVLAGIVLRAQFQTTGQANFQRGAQTRLRGLLHTILPYRPAPFGQPAAAWEEWLSRTEHFLVVAFTESMSLYERNPVQNESHLFFATDVAS